MTQKQQTPWIRYWPVLIFAVGFIGTSAVQAYQVDELNQKVNKNTEATTGIPYMKEDISEIKDTIKDMQQVQTTQTAIMARIEAKL